MSTTTLQNARIAPSQHRDVVMGFASLESFELMQRAAKLLASSTLVPVAYRSVIEKLNRDGSVRESRQNPNALANAVVALNMAQRMNADPLMVMQNLYIVEGRPSWSSQWIIAAINGCGRFSSLRFDLKNLGIKKVEYVDSSWENNRRVEEIKQIEIENIECIAWALEKDTGERIESPPVSIELAVKEGWYQKKGSKWQTMPEVMLRYRTASFFGKLYAPELLMGLTTVEEAQDMIIDATTAPDGSIYVNTDEIRQEESAKSEKRAARKQNQPDPAEDAVVQEQQSEPQAHIDQETGEVIQQEDPQASIIPDDDDENPFPDAKPVRTRRTANVE